MRSHMARRLGQIAGFLEPGDAAMIATLLSAQTAAGLTGPVAEIGVHHGKLILGMVARIDASERAVAIDLFDDQAMNVDKSGKGDLAVFEGHAARLGVRDRISVIKADSTRLTPDGLLGLSGAPFRMFSVDGGHSYDVVLSDMRLAAATLCAGGVILADDYFNYGWPDVSYAVARFVQAEDNPVIPFAASSSKLYLTNSRQWADRYRDALVRAGSPSLEKIQKMGRDDVHVFDTRSFGSAAFTFVRILKSRLRASRLPGIPRASDRLPAREHDAGPPRPADPDSAARAV